MENIHINLTCNFKGIKDGAAKCTCKCESAVLNPKFYGDAGAAVTAAMCMSILKCMRDNFGKSFDVAMLAYMHEGLENDKTVQECKDTDSFNELFGDLFDDE